MSSKCSRLKRKLKQIIKESPHSIRAEVAREALDCGYEIEKFFSDLLTYGCQSGMIGTLIYYYDTHRFYDKHYDEIEVLRFTFEEDFGEPLQPKGDLKNWFAWMAFEEVANALYRELYAAK